MNDFDLDHLGDVWRQQPAPAEMERLQRTAATVARRARFARIVDVGTAMVVSIVVILLVASHPRVDTVLMGAAAILVLLGGNLRQRRLRQVELRSFAGRTEDMLDQSIERVETTLRHNKLSLIGFAPCILIGLLLASASGWRGTIIGSLGDTPLLRIARNGMMVAILASIALFLVFVIRRGRRELGRLQVMREAYRQERESAAP